MNMKQKQTEATDFMRPVPSIASGDSVKHQLKQNLAVGDETPDLNFAAFNLNEIDSGRAAKKQEAPSTRVRTIKREENEKHSNDSSIRNFLSNNFYRSVDPSPGGVRIAINNNDDTPLMRNVKMEDFLKKPTDQMENQAYANDRKCTYPANQGMSRSAI
jgi:hypothetical protein